MNEPPLVILSFDPQSAPAANLKVLIRLPGALRPEDTPDELPPADVVILLSEPASPTALAEMLAAAVARWQATQKFVDAYEPIFK